MAVPQLPNLPAARNCNLDIGISRGRRQVTQMLHPVAANLAFSLGKRMGRSNGGHDPSRSVQVGNPRLNGELRCPGK
jgi:hypothetical protein